MFIVNPHARNGRAHAKLEALREALKRQGIGYDLRTVECLDHARALSREANLTGYDTVVAVGGDGTINRVLDGFFAADGLRLSAARLAVIHVGTSPDFCRSHGVPTDLHEAVATLVSGVTKPVYPGRVFYMQRPPTSTTTAPAASFFACCANAGFGATLARLANGGIRKHLGDFAGTLLCLLRVIRSFRPVTLNIELDGIKQELRNVYDVAVGRSQFVASGLQISHCLQAVNSQLYVVCLRDLSPRNLLPVLLTLYGGRPIGSRSCLSIQYARTVCIRPARSVVELEFDGDPAGWCPADFRVASEPVDLLVPASL